MKSKILFFAISNAISSGNFPNCLLYSKIILLQPIQDIAKPNSIKTFGLLNFFPSHSWLIVVISAIKISDAFIFEKIASGILGLPGISLVASSIIYSKSIFVYAIFIHAS